MSNPYLIRTTLPNDSGIEYKCYNYSLTTLLLVRICRYIFISINLFISTLLILPAILKSVGNDNLAQMIEPINDFLITLLGGSENFFRGMKEHIGIGYILLFIALFFLSSLCRRNMMTIETLRIDTKNKTCEYIALNDLGKVLRQKMIQFDQVVIFIHEYFTTCHVRYLINLCDKRTIALPSSSHNLKQLQTMLKIQQTSPKGSQDDKDENDKKKNIDYNNNNQNHQNSNLSQQAQYTNLLTEITASCTTDQEIEEYIKSQDLGLLIPLFLPQKLRFNDLQKILIDIKKTISKVDKS